MPNKNEVIEYQSSLFHSKKKLIFTKDTLIFKSKSNNVVIKKEDIQAFKFGIRWVSGFEFIIGRNYCIDIKLSHSTKKIRLLSVYGNNKQILWDKYIKIINYLEEYYFGPIIEKMITDILQNKDVQLDKLTIRNDGIILKKNIFVPWENLGSRNFEEYYSLYPKDEPNNYMAFNYLKDWNSGIIFSLTRSLLKEKGYWEEASEEIVNAKS